MKSVGILLAKWTKKLLFTQPDVSRLTLQASHFTPHAYEPDRPNKRDMSNVETRPLSYSSLSEMAADVPRIKEVFAQQKFG